MSDQIKSNNASRGKDNTSARTSAMPASHREGNVRRDSYGVEILGGYGEDDGPASAMSAIALKERVWGFKDVWDFEEHIVRLYNPQDPVIIFGHVGFKPENHPALTALIRDFNETSKPLVRAADNLARNRGFTIDFNPKLGINVVNGPWTCPEYTVLGMYRGFLVSSDFVERLDKDKQMQFDTGYIMGLDSENPMICGEGAYIDGHPFLFWKGEHHFVNMNAAYINSTCEYDNTSFLLASRINRKEECDAKRDCVTILHELSLKGIFDGKSDEFMRLLVFAVTSEDVPKFRSFVLRYSLDAESSSYWIKRSKIPEKLPKAYQSVCNCMCRLFEGEDESKLDPKFKHSCPNKMARVQDMRLCLDDRESKKGLDLLKESILARRIDGRETARAFHKELNTTVNRNACAGRYQILTGAYGFTDPKIKGGQLVRAFNKRVKPLCEALERTHQQLGLIHSVGEDGVYRVHSGQRMIKQGTPLFIGCGAIGFGAQETELEFFSHILPEKIDGQECYINSYSTLCEKYPHKNLNGFELQHSCRRYNITPINAADRTEVILSRDEESAARKSKVKTSYGRNEIFDSCLKVLDLDQIYQRQEPYFVLPLVLFAASEDIRPMTELSVPLNIHKWNTERACRDIADSLNLLPDQKMLECPCESPYKCPAKMNRISSSYFEDPIRLSNLNPDAASKAADVEIGPRAQTTAPGMGESGVVSEEGQSISSTTPKATHQPPATPGKGKHTRDDEPSPPEAPVRKQHSAFALAYVSSGVPSDDDVIIVDGSPPRTHDTHVVIVDLVDSPESLCKAGHVDAIDDAVISIDGAGPAASSGQFQASQEDVPKSRPNYATESDSDHGPDVSDEQAGASSSSPAPVIRRVRKSSSNKGRLPPGKTKKELIDEHVAKVVEIVRLNEADYDRLKQRIVTVRNEKDAEDTHLERILLNPGVEAARERTLLRERIRKIDERLRLLLVIKDRFDPYILAVETYRLSKNALKKYDAEDIQNLIKKLHQYRFCQPLPGDDGDGAGGA